MFALDTLLLLFTINALIVSKYSKEVKLMPNICNRSYHLYYVSFSTLISVGIYVIAYISPCHFIHNYMLLSLNRLFCPVYQLLKPYNIIYYCFSIRFIINQQAQMWRYKETVLCVCFKLFRRNYRYQVVLMCVLKP